MAGIEPRRQDPSSTTHGPAAAVLVAGGAVVSALPAAEITARALTGGGVALPDNPLLTAWGVLSGQPGLGYATTQPAPARALIIAAAVLLEITVITLLVLAGRRWSAVISPGSAHSGFSTVAQVRAVLGEDLLYRRRHEIRPDLYGRRSTPVGDVLRRLYVGRNRR